MPYTNLRFTYSVNKPLGSTDTVCPRQSVTPTFDRLTLKLVCESHLSIMLSCYCCFLSLWRNKYDDDDDLRWETFIPNLDTLGLCILKLFAMYATDGQKQRLLPPSLQSGHNNFRDPPKIQFTYS